MIGRRLGALAVTLALASGCSPAPALTPGRTPAGTGSPTASVAPDFAAPGAARAMIGRLLAASGVSEVVLVDVRRTEVSIGVVKDGRAHTWAYRDGRVQEVPSDLADVEQTPFSPDAFALDDVGRLFRIAAAVSGSDENQELQIVDRQPTGSTGADATMTVSTNPESRAVFFSADGALVPTLDFNTPRGIGQGLRDAVGTRTSVTVLSIGSVQGAYVEFPGAASGTTVRRQRTARIAVSEALRNEADRFGPFDPRRVDAGVIWAVLQRSTRDGFRPTTVWAVTVDARDGAPRMRFTIGATRVVTDLAGQEVRS